MKCKEALCKKYFKVHIPKEESEHNEIQGLEMFQREPFKNFCTHFETDFFAQNIYLNIDIFVQYEN